jgi:hypothetical protein
MGSFSRYLAKVLNEAETKLPEGFDAEYYKGKGVNAENHEKMEQHHKDMVKKLKMSSKPEDKAEVVKHEAAAKHHAKYGYYEEPDRSGNSYSSERNRSAVSRIGNI